MKYCTIIGISDSRAQWFPPRVLEVIRHGRVFSGGRRHHDIMSSMLPKDAVWIDITVPLSNTFRQYADYDDIVVFASGDPLFYGFAVTVQREFPDVEMNVYPSFNSLQSLAHKLNMPYNDMHVVSLTGRPWEKFDEALINGERMIGCLTDRKKTPHEIYYRMREYGYDNYRMYVGELLGNEEAERVGEYEATREYANPNCIILVRTHERRRHFGIPENEFHLLGECPEEGVVGRTKMITKMPIRLLSLSMLDLYSKISLWDVGFCTGSVSIEARLQFPHLHITSFEIREEGRRLMEQNSRKFGAPGIQTHIGDFLSMPLEDETLFTRPDAVFIGGHGGKLKEMVTRIKSRLLPDGCIVFNSVSEESRRTFIEAAEAEGMNVRVCHTITVDENNPITILKAE